MAGSRKRGGAKRRGIGCITCRAHPLKVPREHPKIREHMMGEQHRLGLLQMRIAGQYHLSVVFGDGDERLAHIEKLL
jgi:hypothetical protein